MIAICLKIYVTLLLTKKVEITDDVLLILILEIRITLREI